MRRSRPTRSAPCCSRRSSFNRGARPCDPGQDRNDPDRPGSAWPPNGACRSNPEADGDAATSAARQPTDEMAAQWAAMIDEGGGYRPGRQERRRAHPAPGRDRFAARLQRRRHQARPTIPASGRSSISGVVSYERLPMLEIIFDRLVRLTTSSLRQFTSDNVEVSLDRITSVRFGDYLNSIPLPAILAVFKAEQWDNYGLVTVDSSLIYSVIDVLLGGRRAASSVRIEGRPYTTIETSMIRRMVEVILADAEQAFSPVSPVQLYGRSAGDQSALRRHLAPCQCGDSGQAAHRHGGPRRHRSSCCCPMRPSSRSATCCCRCSWARNSAATRSGRAISPPRSARRRSPSTPCSTRPSCRSSA